MTTPTTPGWIKIHWSCPLCSEEQEEAADAGDVVYDLRLLCRKCGQFIEVML